MGFHSPLQALAIDPGAIRKSEDEYGHGCIDEVFDWGGRSKIFWSRFRGSIKSNLVFIPGKAKLNPAAYVTVTEPHPVLRWHRFGEGRDWIPHSILAPAVATVVGDCKIELG